MAKYCIGIDLGGTFIKVGRLDDQRQPGAFMQFPTPTKGGGKAVAEEMVVATKAYIEAQRLAPADIVAVGIGSPGPLKISEGIVIASPNIPDMDNLPIRDLVSQGLGLPAVLENDANAAAYGEYLCGAGKGRGDMVMLTLGTGIGSGVIVDGKVLHGVHEIGAEFGHMMVDPGGELCGCGQRGCLERYCSATYLAAYAQRLLETTTRPSLLRDVLKAHGSLNAKDVNDARKAGDALAAETWDRATYYLAIACVNICRIFDPDEIVLSGGLVKAGEDLMTPLRAHYENLHWKMTKPATPVVISQLGNDAGAIGAAGVAWAKFGRS